MIITSLLDTDLYKFTMMQAVLHQFPEAMVEYRFKCRNSDVDLRPYADEIRHEIDHLASLRLTHEELDYMRGFHFFKSDFIDFLRIFDLNKDFVTVQVDDEFGITIKGPWLHTILFEVPILAIVNEVYYRNIVPNPNYQEGEKRLHDKIQLLKQKVPGKDFTFSEFGTRRRFSKSWQAHVIEELKQELPDYFHGTSNVYFAKQFNLRPHGTMAHEYIQACQALGPRLINSQKFALEKWAAEYRGALGIALSDTLGLSAFIRDFDLYFCKLFDGARQDSGDPFEWGEQIIAHYQQHRIDPRTKLLLFSDSLDFDLAIALYERFHKRAGVAFGIGTYLSNDLGYPPIQNVIKMVYCNDQPVAKLSDSPDKTMCPDASYLTYLKQVFQLNVMK